MDFLDDIRTGERQQIVVAPQIAPVSGEPLAAVSLFVQTVALDHGAHGAVQHQNPLLQECGETGETLAAAERLRGGSTGLAHESGCSFNKKGLGLKRARLRFSGLFNVAAISANRHGLMNCRQSDCGAWAAVLRPSGLQ